MLRVFGWIFLLISIALLALQVADFTAGSKTEINWMLLVLTLGTLVTSAALFAGAPRDAQRRAAGSVGLGIAVILVLVLAYNAASPAKSLTTVEYVLLFAYTAAYAAFGIPTLRGRGLDTA